MEICANLGRDWALFDVYCCYGYYHWLLLLLWTLEGSLFQCFGFGSLPCATPQRPWPSQFLLFPNPVFVSRCWGRCEGSILHSDYISVLGVPSSGSGVSVPAMWLKDCCTSLPPSLWWQALPSLGSWLAGRDHSWQTSQSSHIVWPPLFPSGTSRESSFLGGRMLGAVWAVAPLPLTDYSVLLVSISSLWKHIRVPRTEIYRRVGPPSWAIPSHMMHLRHHPYTHTPSTVAASLP